VRLTELADDIVPFAIRAVCDMGWPTTSSTARATSKTSRATSKTSRGAPDPT